MFDVQEQWAAWMCLLGLRFCFVEPDSMNIMHSSQKLFGSNCVAGKLDIALSSDVLLDSLTTWRFCNWSVIKTIAAVF